MSEQSPSAWARPGPDDARPEAVITPPTRSASVPLSAPKAPVASAPRSAGGTFGAGTVTGTALLTRSRPEPLIDLDLPPDPAVKRRRTMLWFAGAAGGIVAAAVAILLALVLTGNSPIHRSTAAPPDVRSQLAKLCPPPSGPSAPLGATPPTPAGPRTVDDRAGISYQALGPPWRTWNRRWDNAGDLQVQYRTGQYFVTENYDFGQYLATILSASVPTATNDALTLDLKCTGAQVTADVRTAYYPQPNTMDPIRDERTTLGGRPAWVSEFRLHFHEPSLRATSELVAVAVIDVGRPSAAVLYISIPGTHSQYDHVVDDVLNSVRPAGS
jgi:hypothetical protein